MGTKTGRWLTKDKARPEEGKNNDHKGLPVISSAKQHPITLPYRHCQVIEL
jgi:hypothetical protein